MTEPARSFIETDDDGQEAVVRRRQRRVRLHTRLVPGLRVLGFALLSIGIALHNLLMFGEVSWGWLLSFLVIGAVYSLASWLILVRFYAPERRLDLSLVFVVLDVLPITYAIYASGGEKSLLFFALTARVADQVHSGFRRALAFAHLTAGSYLLMLGFIALVEQRPVDWLRGLTILTFLYGINLYFALAARPSDHLRARNREAVRYARELITRLRRSSSELEKARSLAEDANEAKSRFLANTSHELRTPMNAVIGMNRMLMATDLAPDQRELAETVALASENLLLTIDDIMDFSALDAGSLGLEPSDVDLHQTVANALRLVQDEAKRKGLALKSAMSDDLPAVLRSDSRRLSQILVKLLANAVKFTELGTVTVRLEAMAEGAVRFAIEDTGIGVPAEHQEKIFAPFTQGDSSTTRRYAGTGLGLTICRALVERLGGRLNFESRPEGGSVFWFALPPLTTEPDDSDESTHTVSPGRFTGSVLVAEDNLINLKLTFHQLHLLGVSVEVAANGREALEALNRRHFDLVLMDIQMPELDGYGVTSKLRQMESGSGRRTPVIALTAHALSSDRERCLAAGMDDHLTKPASIEDLRQILERWLPVQRTPASRPDGLDLETRHPTAAEPPTLDPGTVEQLRRLGERSGRELLQEMGAIFLRETPKRLSELRKALDAQDASKAGFLVHSLKGSSGSLGALGLAAVCSELEMAARNLDLVTVKDGVAKLEREFARARQALDDLGVRTAR